MSVKIRLKKLGRRHRPFFRVCAMDTHTRRDGREIEILGTYDPMVPETDARAMLNGERIEYWLSVGAKPTPKVSTLIKKYGLNGTHLEAQQAALEKLGSRRAASISAAVAEAEETKLEVKAEETAEEATESANAEGTAADDAATTETETTETAESEASDNSDSGDAATESAAEAASESTESTEAEAATEESGDEAEKAE